MKVAISLCIILPFVAAFLSTPLEEIPDSSNVHFMPLVLEKEPSKKPPEIEKTRANNDEVEDKAMKQMVHGQAWRMSRIKDEVSREEAIYNALMAEKIQSKENVKLSARVRQLESVTNNILPCLAIRQKIEIFELRYGLDLRSVPDDVKFKGIPGNHNFHTKTCLAIFNQTGNAGVKRVIQLLKDENLTVGQFCDVFGYLFVFASDNVHIPRIAPYTEEDILQALNFLNIRDPATTKAVLVLWNSV